MADPTVRHSDGWLEREIRADAQLQMILTDLERRDDDRHVMTLLGEHAFSFAWGYGELLCTCSRTEMRPGDTLSPLQARVVFEHWRERIAADLWECVVARGGPVDGGYLRWHYESPSDAPAA